MAENEEGVDSESSANLLPETLDIDIEELDDDEYEIPPVDKQPTLESILNDLDDQGSLSDEDVQSPLQQVEEQTGYVHESSETLSLTSRGSSDARSRTSSERKRRRRSPNGVTAHGAILRHLILKGISSQLMSACERVNAGQPSAMAVTTMIAVGTSHGLVLVFDASQTLNWCLGTTALGEEYGSVSSLCFNYDCSRILVGFAKGHILMYDLTNGKLLRTMTDAHPPGTAVLHVKFTDSPTLALCSDSGGSVFELNFKRTMGVRGCDSRCLFSGSRGEVCTLEPLLLHHFHSHPLHDVVMVAMATLSKVIVVTIRPRMRVLFTHALQANPTTLPLLTWQFVIIQVADSSRVVDPVLAFGRESTMFFFQVSLDQRNKIRFIPLQKMTVSYLLLNFQWLNSRTLAVIDTIEQLHLIDVRTQEELEVVDLSDVKLVYGTSHFKGLATGGNVSKAMALAGERACYNSVVSFGNQILILGTKSFHVLTIRLWSERLTHLVKQNRYVEALALGMAFYEDKGKAVVGLKGPKQKRKDFVIEKVLEILNSYIDEVLAADTPNKDDEALRDHYEEVVPVCVEYSVNLDQLDLLFGKVYDAACVHPLAKTLYLEAIEPFILNDRLPSVPPTIMQEFVSHYEQSGLFQALEACIVHLDVTSIDIHQVMTLCWMHGLYDAIIYIYNRGMMDYITPMEELMTVLQNALATGKQLSDSQIILGNKLMVYISCCLAGRAYPIGDIPEDQVQSVKYEIFKCLTSLHSKNASDSELSYPYLRALLHFDTREFLNVLALAFEEPEFTSELGLRQRQRIVDILLLIMVHGEGFTPSQVGSLFTFLARQLAKPASGLQVETQLFEQVVEFLTGTDLNESEREGGIGHHEERQQALLELLRADGLHHYNQDHLLELAEKAKFFRVCELLYGKREEYHKILYCYLRDPLRKPQVFSYLRNILVLFTNYMEKPKIENQIIDNIQELVDIDSKKTGQIVTLHLPQCISTIVSKLETEPKAQYQFLQGLFEYRESHSSFSQGKDEQTIEPYIVEKYIELMCQFNPNQVCSYIKNSEGYRLDETLQITKHYEQMEAIAYLLEKAGDIQGAFNLMLEKLQAKVNHVVEQLTKEEKDVNLDLTWSQLNTLIVVIVQLCQRGSALLDENGREQLWFPLLECLMQPQRNLKDQILPENLQAFKELTHHLLNSMIGYVSLPAVIQIILQDPAYSGGKFGEIRDLLMGMLENSCYEETLLVTTSRLLSTDLHHQLAQLLASANRGLTPRSISPHTQIPKCSLCERQLDSVRDSENVILFRCGHSYHVSCLQPSVLSSSKAEWLCYHCANITRPGIIPKVENQVNERTAPYLDAITSPTEQPLTPAPNHSVLHPEQLQAVEKWRKTQITPSLALLGGHSHSTIPWNGDVSLLHREDFALKLEAPRQVDLEGQF